MVDADQYFAQNFNTELTPEEEAAFQSWISQASAQQGRDMSLDLQNYDMRGFWASGGSQAANGHFTDEYKKPNHPTFSNESIYHGVPGPDGTVFEGGAWVGDNFMPSKKMLATTHNIQDLQRYMEENEPNSILMEPLP